MKEKLENTIEDKSLLDRVVKAYKQYGTMSVGYLAHKFRFNVSQCQQIMKTIKDWEKHSKIV